MATKVYLSGDVVVVDKPTEPPILNIPIGRAKGTFYADRPTTTSEVVDFDRVAIFDIVTEENRFDTVANIQDAGGTPIGDFLAVKKYLAGLFSRFDTVILNQ